MKAKRRIVGALFGLLAASAVQAVPDAVVEMVQAPAWVERMGQRLPLVAGMALHNRDKLETGVGARVVLAFADGSAARIGENALVAVNAMAQEKNGRFTGGLDLKSGDLRLIAHDYAEAPVKRAINVRFGEVTAAVRGESDLTGSVEATSDAVALRDGQAVVSHPQAAEPVRLNQPLQTYVAMHGQAPQAVRQIDRFVGANWALRTQPYFDAATQQPAGRWQLSFGSFDKNSVLVLYDRLRQAGFAAKVLPQNRGGGLSYELRLMHLVTERAAQLLAERLVGELQMPMPTVSLRR
jgi:hypothetical protein